MSEREGAKRPSILVIDDNAVDREHVRRLLGATCTVREAATAQDGLWAIEHGSIDCVLLDYRLPDSDGVEVIDQLTTYAIPVLMLTSQGSESVAVEAMKRGATDYIVKATLSRETLRRAVAAAIDRGQLERELHARTVQLEEKNAALAEREAQLRILLEQLPAITWTANRDLCISSVSGAALRALGMNGEAMIGQPLASVIAGMEDVRGIVAVHARALEGASAHYAAGLGERRLHCHVEPLRDREGAITGVIGVALDITESTRLERQLRQAMRMDALGKLAGGVAHDFNNILTAIVSFADLAAAELPPDHPSRADLEQVTIAGERATQLVKQLLLFSRQQRTAPETLSPARVVHELMPMLQRLLGADMALAFEHDEPTWNVRIDRGSLEQIVVNLVVNGRDAMPDGGRLLVELRNSRAAPGEPESLDHVVLSVADEGVGIPVEIRERVFEPFFTTKDVGRGTGLGLSTVYGAVKDAAGTVRLESEVGRGTTVFASLPRAESAPVARESVPDRVSRGVETVLVVEDETPVRMVAVRALERLGYTVLQATDAASALAVCDSWESAIHLVLTDVVMPGEDGPSMVARLRSKRPSTRVLFMTGYADPALRERHPVLAASDVLEKPLRPDALARAIRKALDA